MQRMLDLRYRWKMVDREMAANTQSPIDGKRSTSNRRQAIHVLGTYRRPSINLTQIELYGYYYRGAKVAIRPEHYRKRRNIAGALWTSKERPCL